MSKPLKKKTKKSKGKPAVRELKLEELESILEQSKIEGTQ